MTETKIISSAMYELARTIHCDDGIANAACAEAALRLDEQTVKISVLEKQLENTERALIDLRKEFTPPTTKEAKYGRSG